MAIKIVRRGNAGQSNDHNLLINRGEPDQHAIEAITGLRTALNSKYVKPLTGIPRGDLGFPAVSSEELQGTRSELFSEMDIVSMSQLEVENKIEALEQYVLTIDNSSVNGDITATTNIVQINGFYEVEATADQSIFDISFEYVVGAKQLEVFIDGVMCPRSTYTELSATSFRIDRPLYGGEIITAKADVVSHITSPIHESFIHDGSNLIATTHRYNVGDHSLSVFKNGIRLDVDVDYQENSSNEIEILNGSIQVGDRVTLRRETHMVGKVVYTPLDKSFMTWHERPTIQEDDMTLIFIKSYLVGGNMIQVFCNGLLMEPGPSGDYMEMTNTSIKFNEPIDSDDDIRVVCNAGLMEWKERFVSINGLKRFELSNPYNPGVDELEVYENGMLISVIDDYIETNRTTVTLKETPENGSVIIIFRRR